MARVVRGTGWALIAGGTVVLLYVAYLMWFTGISTDREQQHLAEQWDTIIREAPAEVDDIGPAEPAVDVGDAYAAMWFERDGEMILHDSMLFVVNDVTVDALRKGPGHYPGSDRPGGPGNHAIAGHRTTYGSPFWAIDELQEGDTIHVADRQGREWVYAYREQRIVSPADVWVIGDDPLETGSPTITLTTCHPRFSAAQRLIVWGELIGDPLEPPPVVASPVDDSVVG